MERSTPITTRHQSTLEFHLRRHGKSGQVTPKHHPCTLHTHEVRERVGTYNLVTVPFAGSRSVREAILAAMFETVAEGVSTLRIVVFDYLTHCACLKSWLLVADAVIRRADGSFVSADLILGTDCSALHDGHYIAQQCLFFVVAFCSVLWKKHIATVFRV